jgi:hypothetical protein
MHIMEELAQVVPLDIMPYRLAIVQGDGGDLV